MFSKITLTIFSLFLSICFIGTDSSFASDRNIPETDSANYSMYSFFDLRDRESFVQVTNTANPAFIVDPGDDDDDDNVEDGMFDVSGNITVHVQIFNVANNCNENDFFDTLTPNDTHIYNMRDIQTNNGSPSGVVLPDGAYGFVVISAVDTPTLIIDEDARILIGNFRVVDNLGYEYRTNSNGQQQIPSFQPNNDFWYFNFNSEEGVILSDVIAIQTDDDNNFNSNEPSIEVNILDSWNLMDINIYDVNEVPFSCRNVIFSCVDQDNPLLEALLEDVSNDGSGAANVASFVYGINEAIPHSKGGELLCPGNVINEGIVTLEQLTSNGDLSAFFVGLNNGNGRGSMDAWWSEPPSDFNPED